MALVKFPDVDLKIWITWTRSVELCRCGILWPPILKHVFQRYEANLKVVSYIASCWTIGFLHAWNPAGLRIIRASPVFEKWKTVSKKYLHLSYLFIFTSMHSTCSYHLYIYIYINYIYIFYIFVLFIPIQSNLPWCYPCLGVGAHQRLFLRWTLQLHWQKTLKILPKLHHQQNKASVLQCCEPNCQVAVHGFGQRCLDKNHWVKPKKEICATRMDSGLSLRTIIMRYICVGQHDLPSSNNNCCVHPCCHDKVTMSLELVTTMHK